MNKRAFDSLPVGPIERISFVIDGAKEREYKQGNYSQMVFVKYDDFQGFAILNNQEEVTEDDKGTTFLFIATNKEYKGSVELKGVEKACSGSGKEYIKIGKAAMRFIGEEIADAPNGPLNAKSPQAKPRSSGVADLASMEEMITYGVAGTQMATKLGLPNEALASVFGACMFGFKEGRPLYSKPKDVPREDDLVTSAKEFLDADDDGDEIAF